MTTPGKVYTAFAAAMADVEKVAKLDTNQHQRFNFRGIDATMNAVGPVFRKHKLFILPELLEKNIDHAATNAGKRMTTVHIQVRFTVMHEDGSSMSGVTPGEANDTSDKATAKAMSVALRTFLLQSMLIPTDDPEPDSYSDSAVAPGYKQVDLGSATRQQLLDAMHGAQQAGDREFFERVQQAGKDRFGGQ